MSEETTPVHPIPSREKTDGEMVLDYIKTLHTELENLQERYDLLDAKVNKELPAQLDQAFKDIQQNFQMISKGVEAIAQQRQNTPLATAAGQPQSGGTVQQIFDSILKTIDKVTGSGTQLGGSNLSDFDKEILKLTKQIQMISLKDVLKKTAKSAGVEVADHIVIS